MASRDRKTGQVAVSSHRVFESAGELRPIVNAWQKRTHNILGEATPLEAVHARGQETASPPVEKRGMPIETRTVFGYFSSSIRLQSKPKRRQQRNCVTSNDLSQNCHLNTSQAQFPTVPVPHAAHATFETETRLTSATCRDVFPERIVCPNKRAYAPKLSAASVNVGRPGISDVSVIHTGSTASRSHSFEMVKPVKADGVYSPGSSSSKPSVDVDCRTMRSYGVNNHAMTSQKKQNNAHKKQTGTDSCQHLLIFRQHSRPCVGTIALLCRAKTYCVVDG
jgi:hypothetical protein